MADWQSTILARLAGDAGDPLFLPDLTLWHHWHSVRGTLAAALAPALHELPAGDPPSLAQVCRALGLPAWVTCTPWQAAWQGATVTTTEAGGERVIRYETGEGTLVARWVQRDGDWWQTAYPVKGPADLPAARAAAAARTYTLDASGLPAVLEDVGTDGVVAVELPMRPYADILHTLLGWEEGLLLWAGEGRDELREMQRLLEEKLAGVVAQVAELPVAVVLAPDNLDGQFISPRAFRSFLLSSYAATAATLHAAGKRLVVHAGGPVRRLLPLLAEAGVDAVEGIAGPPQGDATLGEARSAAGPELALWGGIPQDYLLPTVHDAAAFHAAVKAAVLQARGDARTLLGVADRTPVDADITRVLDIARSCHG